MGNVASRTDEQAPLYIRDQDRLTLKNVKIIGSKNRLLYNIIPNSFPASRYYVHRAPDDEAITEYIQDPDSSSSASTPNFLLRINNDDDIQFYFTFAMRRSSTTPSVPAPSAPPTGGELSTADTIIKGLTFITAPTPRELETLLTREFNADPNLHRNPNVDLVGDYSTNGLAQEQFEWSWKWRPPKLIEDKGGGWKNSCSFVEYDQRAHRLNTLVRFSFWVHNIQRKLSPQSSPAELLVPPRIRVPSAQSIDSRLSDSDTEPKEAKDRCEPSSPFETIPETEPPLESTTTPNAVKVDINCQPIEGDISNADDGPVFRATIKALESKTGSVRQRMKKVLKKAEAARESQIVCNAAVDSFMDSLKEASTSNANAVQPAIDHYFEKIAKEILRYEKANAEHLQRFVVEPLTRIYGNDIKQAEAKRKEFEEESRDYYQYVGRYLGQRQDSLKEKKKAESDTKYENKRRTFELKRFDYSSFMQDLHGGRKDQEVLSQLTKFADAQASGYLSTAKKVESLLPQLEALAFEVKEANKQYQLMRTGREERRRGIERSSKSYADTDSSSMIANAAATDQEVVQLASIPSNLPDRPKSGVPAAANGFTANTLDPSGSGSPRLQAVAMAGSPAMDRFKGYRDLEARDLSADSRAIEPRKEGLLWSLSRPGSHADPKGLNKQAWHKYWVVLDQGRLSEYVNWKQNMEQHIGPIDLRVASVREARNTERRFCFEVITPHFTRVYQATGEDDMRSWIHAINNALQGAFEGKTAPVPEASSTPTKSGGSIAQNLFGKSSSYHGHRSSSSAAYLSNAAKNVNRNATVGDRPSVSRSRSSEERPGAHLLAAIRSADVGNAWCAECGSDSRVEWVSINLGIIVCIECSGIHRSMGTHVSKMRSLTLDTTSFTQDIVELLLSLGNRVSNMTWEARLDRAQKLSPTANREQRMSFITTKYAQRAYVEPLSASSSHFASADDTLLASIKKNDLQNVYYALALSANPNATDRSRGTHAVFLALAAADPAAPGAASQNSSQASDSSQQRKSFPLAELLLQNGAELPSQPAPIPLSKAAAVYVELKKAQKQGRLAPPGTSPAEGGSSGSSAPPWSAKEGSASYPGTEKKEGKFSSKKVSTGHQMANKLAKGAGVL